MQVTDEVESVFSLSTARNCERSRNYCLRPGYLFAGERTFRVSTVLGSCVSVVPFDLLRGIGGINRYCFVLARTAIERNTRFGDVAISAIGRRPQRRMGQLVPRP